jgi:hypothetical protein
LSCLRFDLSVLYVDKSLGFSRVRTECNFSLVTFAVATIIPIAKAYRRAHALDPPIGVSS